MSSDWRTGKLGDFIELKRGYDLPKPRRTAGNIPLVSSSGISDSHSVAMVKGPGVITGRYGTIGQVFYVEKDFWPLNTTLYVRDFKGNEPRFIHYFLKTLNFSAYSDKGAVPGVNRNHLHEALVTIPHPTKQSMISKLLASFDAKIDILCKQNVALESVAKTLFRSWFVDFDTARAKSAGKEPDSVSVELAALFPSEFEDSELGPIPKGWAVTSFGDVFEIKGGGTPSTKESSYWDNGTHWWATPKDLSNLASKVIYKTAFKLSAAGVKKISSKTLPIGTILMSSRAPVGYLAIAKAPISINQGFIAIPPIQGLPPSFIVNLLLYKMAEIKANAGGTTFAEISKSQFRPIKWVRPPQEILEAFGRIAEPIYAAVHTNCLTIDALSSLRDHLIPRLISGKLGLEEAEASVEALTLESKMAA